MDKMGQDSESAAEFVMTVRTEHVAMKTWYNNNVQNHHPIITNLKEKYGDYPALWKEVLNWSGWKETRKEYLRFQQSNETMRSTTGNNQTGQTGQTGSNTQSTTTETTTRKRKSRWGTANVGGDNTNDGNHNNIDPMRRQRWDHGDQPQHQQQQFPPQQQQPPASSHSLIPPLLLPGLLPGSNGISNVQLTPQQQQEMEALRSRLRIVNEKLEKIDSEAERIDALPRSHPERSPSPPPSTYFYCFYF
jgi:hypothetical protein